MEENNLSREFYSNLVEVSTSLFDVTLQFKLRNFSKADEDTKNAIDVCNVRMSPQHAKALMVILLKHISNYEKDLKCELPLSPDLQNMIDEIQKEENNVENNE